MKNLITTITLIISISFSGFCGDFKPFFWHTMKMEGRFSEIKFDRGGATMFGVTLKTFQGYCQNPAMPIDCDRNKDKKVSTADMFFLRPVDVYPIYKRDYWDVLKADSIKNQAIAEFMVDFIVNSGGSSWNIKALQKTVGAYPDGKFGVKTLARINGQNANKLFAKLYKFRQYYYYRLAAKDHSQKRFLRGWLNRISNLKTIYKNEKFI